MNDDSQMVVIADVRLAKLDFLSLLNEAQFKKVEPADQTNVMSYALGLAIALTLPVPTSPVSGSLNYYKSYNEPVCRNIAGMFNEQVAIKYELVNEFACNIWQLRYNMVHPNETIAQPLSFGFFDTIMGVRNFIDDNTHACVNTYKFAIIDLANVILKLIAKFKNI